MPLTTPVTFIIFNRPLITERVFAQIRLAKPTRLFLISDGPRSGNARDAENCPKVRAIVEHIDWDCDVRTNYSPVNLGCGKRISSGIDWVFEQVEEAIILEDDCLPGPTFFPYCEDLLQRYRGTPEVMMVGGTNPLTRWEPNFSSYFFSHYAQVWGWATWRRAWKYFDYEMRSWTQESSQAEIRKILRDNNQYQFWYNIFSNASRLENKDIWDAQWVYSIMLHHGVAITPAQNQVSNIVLGEGGTHIANTSPFSNLPTYTLGFPLRHPTRIQADMRFDRRLYDAYMWKLQLHPVIKRLKRIKRWLLGENRNQPLTGNKT